MHLSSLGLIIFKSFQQHRLDETIIGRMITTENRLDRINADGKVKAMFSYSRGMSKARIFLFCWVELEV